SLWGSPVVVSRPCTGARSATSYRMCTTGSSLGYKSHGGARSTGHLWYSQRGTRYDHCNHRLLKWYRAPTRCPALCLIVLTSSLTTQSPHTCGSTDRFQGCRELG